MSLHSTIVINSGAAATTWPTFSTYLVPPHHVAGKLCYVKLAGLAIPNDTNWTYLEIKLNWSQPLSMDARQGTISTTIAVVPGYPSVNDTTPVLCWIPEGPHVLTASIVDVAGKVTISNTSGIATILLDIVPVGPQGGSNNNIEV